MKIVRAIVLVLIILIAVLLTVISWPFVPYDEPWLDKYDESGLGSSIRIVSKTLSVEDQIMVLDSLGYTIKPEMLESYYGRVIGLRGWPADVLERYPYWLVFTALGWEDTDDIGKAVYYSDSTYCFYNTKYSSSTYLDKIYVNAMEQINRISERELNITNVNVQYYSLGVRTVISYEVNGESFKKSIHSSRYFNANILEEISQYSENDNFERNLYWMHDEHGFHIIYRTYDEIVLLNEVTGINFEGFDSNQLSIAK